jgi:hypothetical protein
LHYLFTGKAPEELKDYYFPRAGAPGTEGWNRRNAIASYMKDVVHYGRDPYGTLRGKVQPLLTLTAEMLSNKDYYNRPIRNREDPLVKQLEEAAAHVGTAFQPISMRGLFTLGQAQKKRTHEATAAEILLPMVGITPAPKYITEGDQPTKPRRLRRPGYPVRRLRRTPVY